MLSISGKKVTVAGLGRFGGNIAAARWLTEQGARVTVSDRDAASKLADSVKQLEGLPIEFHLGSEDSKDFTQADLVVASPAIPMSNPLLEAARTAGVPITTEIRLFIERCPASIVGVTGTKGKSTTSAMLGRMLKQKFTTHFGGNIGKSLLLELGNIEPHDLVVLELSSYMLEHLRAIKWSPHVALITMVGEDHLEWHGSAAAYRDAKKVILEYQRRDDYAVVNELDAASIEMADATPARVVYFGVKGRKRFALKIPGEHNQMNAQAAFAAAACMGISWEQAQAAVVDFPGLPHRLELVHEKDGVRYINDSIATIPQAAVAALESFPPGSVIQIVGGYDKHLDMTPLVQALAKRAKAVLCIGTIGKALAEAVKQNGAAALECGDLEAAMKVAKQQAKSGDTVLLSTGCASYDQFANFEKRGEMFARLARGESL